MKKNKNQKSEYYQQKQQQYLKKTVSVFEMLNIAVLISIIIFVCLCLIFLKRPEYSEKEKRNLTERPKFSLASYLSGEFAESFTAYFSDTVPGRETIVDIGAFLKRKMGIESPSFYGRVQIVADEEGNSVSTAPTEPVSDESPVVTGSDSTVTTVQTETSESEEDGDINIAEFSNNGIVVDGVKMYGEPAGVMLFGGNNKQGSRYAAVINSYKAALGENVNVYNIVVPTSAEFYLPSKFKKYSSSEKNSIDHIYSELSDDVISVDAYSELEAHSDEYIYFRTDHHWTPLGAYYAYTAFAKKLGMDYPSLDDYEEKVKYNFVGSLYGYTNDVTLKNNPDEFHYFMPQNSYETSYYAYDSLKFQGKSELFHEYVEGGNCYGMFLGADAIHTKIKTDVHNGRKIVVFKESYGNAFVPFLVNNFEEIYVIDIRYFGKNAVSYIKQIGATDVLFIDNVFAANTSKLISGIERLYSSPTGTIVYTEPPKTETTAESESSSNTKKTESTTETKSTSEETQTTVTIPTIESESTDDSQSTIEVITVY
jgi:hypothetical protein